MTETTTKDFSRPSGWGFRLGTKTQYDALGRAVAVTNADGSVPQMGYPGTTTLVADAYDALGNLGVVTDALGNTTVITYDALNRSYARSRSTHPSALWLQTHSVLSV